MSKKQNSVPKNGENSPVVYEYISTRTPYNPQTFWLTCNTKRIDKHSIDRLHFLLLLCIP